LFEKRDSKIKGLKIETEEEFQKVGIYLLVDGSI